MKIILGLTGQVVVGVHMYWTQWSEGPCLGEEGGTTITKIIPGFTGQVVGGDCNHKNYSGIDRPGCPGGVCM